MEHGDLVALALITSINQTILFYVCMYIIRPKKPLNICICKEQSQNSASVIPRTLTQLNFRDLSRRFVSLGNLRIDSGLGERAEEGSYRNTLIIWAHFTGTIRGCENSIDSAVKVITQGLESGVVAECMAGRAYFNDEGIGPNLGLAVVYNPLVSSRSD